MIEETGAHLRDEGIQSVLDGDAAVHRGYRAAIERAIGALIEAGEPFTADHVHRLLDDDVRDHASPMLVPAMFKLASQEGRIKTTGWAISERPKRHGGVLRIWLAADTEEAA